MITGCDKNNIDETLRLIKACIYEHIKDFRNRNVRNTLVKHNLETKNSFNFTDSKMLVNIHNKMYINIVESNIISNYNTIKYQHVFFNLSPYLVKSVINSYNITCLN